MKMNILNVAVHNLSDFRGHHLSTLFLTVVNNIYAPMLLRYTIIEIDRINHKLMITMLHHIGFTYNAIKFMTYYLGR